MDAVLHALADESRRTMLDVLRDHPATVTELAELLPIARPGVSRHLRVLREAGLVDVEQQAQWRIYRLQPEAMADLDTWLADYRALWQHRMDALHTEIARGKRNPGQPKTSQPTTSQPKTSQPKTSQRRSNR